MQTLHFHCYTLIEKTQMLNFRDPELVYVESHT